MLAFADFTIISTTPSMTAKTVPSIARTLTDIPIPNAFPCGSAASLPSAIFSPEDSASFHIAQPWIGAISNPTISQLMAAEDTIGRG